MLPIFSPICESVSLDQRWILGYWNVIQGLGLGSFWNVLELFGCILNVLELFGSTCDAWECFDFFCHLLPRAQHPDTCLKKYDPQQTPYDCLRLIGTLKRNPNFEKPPDTNHLQSEVG